MGALGKVTLPQLFCIGVWPTVILVAAFLGAAISFLNRTDAKLKPAPASGKFAASPTQA